MKLITETDPHPADPDMTAAGLPSSLWSRSVTFLPGVVLFAGLALSLWAWFAVSERVRIDIEEEIGHKVNLLTSRLDERLHGYEQLLRGAAGMFAASSDVTFQEFHRYIAALQVHRAYPGIQGVGYAERVDRTAEELEGAPPSVATAMGQVPVWPNSDRPIVSAIRFLEPLDWRNRRALGYDMFAEPVRRRAMRRAMEEGALGMTGIVELVQETDDDVQTGFLMYVPVYREGAPVSTVEQRRAALLGWAYAPFRSADFFRAELGVHDSGVRTPLDLNVYAGPKPSPATLLYSSQAGQAAPLARQPLFKTTGSLALGGAYWTLEFASTPELDARLSEESALWILVLGSGISLLLAAVLWLLAHGRSRATRYAARMNRDLRESELRFRRLADAAPVLIAMSNADHRLEWVNRRWLDFRGQPIEVELTLDRTEVIHPDDVARCAPLFDQSVEQRKPFEMEFRLLRADGDYRWVLNHSAPRLDAEGRFLGFIGTFMDITDRKRVEEELRRANLLVSSVVNAAVDIGITVSDRHGVIQLFNPGAERLFELAADEVIGTVNPRLQEPRELADYRWCDERTGELLTGADAMRRQAEAEGQLHHEWTLIRPSGAAARIHTVITPLRQADGAVMGWLGMNRDVTAQYAAEQRLLESERRLRAIFDASFSLIGLLSPTGTLLDVNRTALRAGRITLDQMIGRPFWEGPWWQTPAARDTIREAVQSAAAGSEIHGEVAVAHGATAPTYAFSIRPVLDNDRCVVLLVLEAQEITERKQAEAALSEQRAFLGKLMSEIPDMVSYWTADERCRFANPAWTSTFSRHAGMPAEELVGTEMPRMLGEFYETIRADVYAVLRGAVQRRERTLADGGDTRYLLMHFIPDIVEREVVGFVVVSTDITELKRIERSLHEQVQRAESATRAKGDFVANMSHEIRTPMNAVLGLTRLMLDTDLNAQQRDYMEMIHSSSRALLQILNDILDYSKVEAGRLDLERDEFLLSEVLENSADLFAVMVESKALELVFEVDAEVPLKLVGDALRLGQVLNNLIGNAVKFTDSGHIHVRVALGEIRDAAAQLQFSVSDTGIGIAGDQISHLFQEFHQADNSTTRRYGGSGLGLSICRRLVGLMGGEIGVESVVGAGSTFTFSAWFDRHGEPLALLGKRLLPMRTLVIDVHRVAATAMQQMLTAWGFTVAVSQPAAALSSLSAAGRSGEPLELIVIECRDPAATAALLEQLAELCRRDALPLPATVGVVPAHGRDRTLAQLEPVALNAVLNKPLTPARLLRAIGSVQGRAAEIEQQSRLPWHARAGAIAGAHILLAEDNPVNQRVARAMLEKMGMAVDIAATGLAAVELARQAHYDLILMDLQMPQMDGFQAAQQIRAERGASTPPIIAMTAAAMTEDRAATGAAGMNGHVAKPVDPDELLEELLRWIPPRNE